jgi:O-antigen/teichoic acid export membrane protein
MPLILVPYVSRTIGLERYGISEFSLELAAFFGTIVLYGFDFTMSKNLSRNRQNKSYFSNLFWNVFYSRIAISLFLIPVFWYTGNYFLDDLFTNTVLLYAFLFVISRVFSSWWFFQGMENIKWIAIGNFLIKTLVLGLVLLLVKNEKDYPFVVFAYGASQLLINLLAWCWIIFKYKIKFFVVQLTEIYRLLKYTFFTFFNEFLIMMFTTVNILIVKNYLSAEELGLYAATMKVVIIVQNLVIQSVSKSLFPNLALEYNKNHNVYKDRLEKFRNMLGFVLLAVALVILTGKGVIVQLLFGSSFSEVTSLLVYVSFLPFFIGMTNIYGWQGLYVMNRERTMSFISLFVGTFSVSCLLLLTERFGLKGVLIIRNISEVMIFTLAYFFFQKIWKSEQKNPNRLS